jgi:hypothetical protein
MEITQNEWVKLVKASDKETIRWLHPCMAMCGKWATCQSGDECIKNLQILDNLWRGKVIAMNAAI